MIRAVFLALALSACATGAPVPESAFFTRLSTLCGQSFAGRVVSTDAVDAAIASETLVMHVRDCSADEIRIPFNVGDNRSRTWVITRTDTGLRLKHDHRHEDGSEDALTQYGGDTVDAGSALRQQFPADAFSKAMFTRNSSLAAVDNLWAMEIEPGVVFAYELSRPNRLFRVEFDLSRPVPTPPPSWGASGRAN
jgi:hypothetical protein